MATAAPPTQLISVALGREELYVIASLLGAKTLAGLDTDWVKFGPDGQPTEATRATLEAASNALIARGYLITSEPGANQSGLTIPSPIIALVGTCYLSEMSVLISLRSPDGVLQAYLHEFRDLGVAHTVPINGIHQFNALNGRAGIIGAINNVLTLANQAALPLAAGQIAAEKLAEAQTAALAGQGDRANQLLTQGGLAAPLAQQLASTIARSTAIGALTVVGRQHGSSSLGLVVATNECFTFTPEGPSSPNVVVQSASADGVRQWVVAHMGQPANVTV